MPTDIATAHMRRKVWPDDYGQTADRQSSTDRGSDRGIRCPKCNCARTEVYYLYRASGRHNHRRRRCGHCGHLFSTYERSA